MSRSRIAQIYYPIAPGICILSHFPLFRPRSPHRLSAGHCFKCACIFDTVTVWCGEIPAVMRRDSRHASRRLHGVRRAIVAISDWLHGSASLQAGEPVALCGAFLKTKSAFLNYRERALYYVRVWLIMYESSYITITLFAVSAVCTM